MDAEIPNDALVEDDQESLTGLQREQVKLLSQEFYDLFGDDETLDSVILSSERNRTEIWPNIHGLPLILREYSRYSSGSIGP
jgi:hypothetical protein